MANTQQARKRVRQNAKRRAHNRARRSAMRTEIKKVLHAIRKGDQESAATAYRQAVPYIDRLATKGIIHKNKAARHKSRLNDRIRALQ